MRTLIVGTGCSGTKWIVETLNSHAVKAEHQMIRHAHVLGEPFTWPDVDVIVSFEAVPLLPVLECRRLLVVRDPDDTIGSWLVKGAFDDQMASKYAMWFAVLDRWFPNVMKEDTPQDRAAHYWADWNLYGSMFCDDMSRLDLIGNTDWFDIVWPEHEKTGHERQPLRAGLRRTVDRMWEHMFAPRVEK